jgi:hypothetical protein
MVAGIAEAAFRGVSRARHRTLIVGDLGAIDQEHALALAGTGSTTTRVATAAEARMLPDHFDKALLQFELPDGSGIVLAADLLLRGRVSTVEFLPPPTVACQSRRTSA